MLTLNIFHAIIPSRYGEIVKIYFNLYILTLKKLKYFRNTIYGFRKNRKEDARNKYNELKIMPKMWWSSQNNF